MAALAKDHASAEGSRMYADASAHRLLSDVSVCVGRQRGNHVFASVHLSSRHSHGENGGQY